MIDCFKNEIFNHYADFKGKTNRHDFWMTILASFVLGLILGVVAGILGKIGYTLIAIIELALLIPSLAMSVRRLHDIGKSGWAILISLIPLVGGIILLVWFCKKGE